MCDNMWNYSSWNNDFYHQYLQQHARMTQWIQNLHQNLSHPWASFTNRETQTYPYQHQQQELCTPEQGYCYPGQGYCIPQQGHYISQQDNYVPQQGHHIPLQGYIPLQGHTSHQGHIPHQVHHIPQQGHYIPQQRHNSQHVQHQMHSFKHHKNSRRNSHYNRHHRGKSRTSADYVSDNEAYVQDNEDKDSDGEWVLNVDAILAFRATKEESEKEEDAKSEESIEFIDTILNENFEFVELDDAGQMQKVIGRKIAPDAKGNFEYDREARILLFGDRADRIAGLETSLEIMFDHINDLHQPVVYPHA